MSDRATKSRMANDWNAMLIDMTSGDDWKKLTQWLADNLLPKIQAAEQWFARFWRTTTDQSKADMLIGILAALGAAFTALAVPVLAATWPFLAIGAAVWLVFEVFNDFISWLDGKGGNTILPAGGIGIYPTFTHIDVRKKRARWQGH